jgi:hypothetical protein
MRYVLVWKGEEIDEYDTREEAFQMAIEYRLAFNDVRVYIEERKQ